MGRAAGARDDDLEAFRLGALGEVVHAVGCAVGGDDAGVITDVQIVENLGGVLHGRPVRLAPHDDGDGGRTHGAQLSQMEGLHSRSGAFIHHRTGHCKPGPAVGPDEGRSACGQEPNTSRIICAAVHSLSPVCALLRGCKIRRVNSRGRARNGRVRTVGRGFQSRVAGLRRLWVFAVRGLRGSASGEWFVATRSTP